MSYKKFENSDLFYNTIKAKPRFEFKIWGGKAVVNYGAGEAILNNLLIAPPAVAPPVVCANQYAFDFSCLENSYNVGLI
jgi:hypothetical protein